MTVASRWQQSRSAVCKMKQAQGRRAILVVDGDATVRDACAWTFTLGGLWVETATSGAEGTALARANDFDMLLLELRLPDMAGSDVIRAIRPSTRDVPFVFIGDHLTVPIAIEAMKLGATDVLQKPMRMERLLEIVRTLADAQPMRRPSVATRVRTPGLPTTPGPPAPRTTRPGSVAERWAIHVLKACESEGDVKTLQAWATCAGVSYSSLRECCGLVGIRPHDARDLTRMLRAVIQSRRQGCAPDVLLDVSDRRTSDTLFERAGLAADSRSAPISLEHFFNRQRFVVGQNAGLRTLRRLLDECAEAS